MKLSAKMTFFQKTVNKTDNFYSLTFEKLNLHYFTKHKKLY